QPEIAQLPGRPRRPLQIWPVQIGSRFRPHDAPPETRSNRRRHRRRSQTSSIKVIAARSISIPECADRTADRLRRELAMRDIADLMSAYRECSRNLWNVYFSK